MELKLLVVLALFLVTSEATQIRPSTMAPPEIYWNLVLPNTLIPEVIKEILNLGNIYKQAGAIKVKLAKINDEEVQTLYFMEQDILPGSTINLHLTKRTNDTIFVPRGIVESMPFSLKKLPEVLSKLSAEPNSAEANIIRKIIQRCEELRNVKGRDRKSCLTSLESMIEFVTTRLGTDFRAINTEVKQEEIQLGQDYTIESSVRKLEGSKFVACHKLNVVYYCHAFNAGEAYLVRVPMKGLNGVEAVGIGVCHIKKQEWDNYLARFPSRMAAAKSGSVPLCQFLAGDSIVWTNKKSVLI